MKKLLNSLDIKKEMLIQKKRKLSKQIKCNWLKHTHANTYT